MSIVIHTDGGNSLKNRVGGCAAIVTKNNVVLAELTEAYKNENVTNNTCELAAVLLAGQYMLDHPELGKQVTIISDSEYVVKGSTTWLPKWKLRGWKTMNGPVKNKELWLAIDYLKTVLDITFKWVKGHAGNSLNQRADDLCVGAYQPLMPK